MAEELIFTTDPHGEQQLFSIESPPVEKTGKRLFALVDFTGGGSIVMTGDELTSLATRWLEFTKAPP